MIFRFDWFGGFKMSLYASLTSTDCRMMKLQEQRLRVDSIQWMLLGIYGIQNVPQLIYHLPAHIQNNLQLADGTRSPPKPRSSFASKKF